LALLFELLWRREYIANIQITIAEELAWKTRRFYDEYGRVAGHGGNHAPAALRRGWSRPSTEHADARFATKSSRSCAYQALDA
jgi:glucose-6-phosphate 1-dehydrogenase